MNDMLAVYLKAYTSKRADDSVADDIAVGAGSGLFGGLMGYAGGTLRGAKLRQNKAPKIIRATDRIGYRLKSLRRKISNATANLERSLEALDDARIRESPNIPWYESLVKRDRDSLDNLKRLVNKNNQRYFKTWSKASKLQNAIKKSKRVGGVAGAVGASLLGTLLYNKLKRD